MLTLFAKLNKYSKAVDVRAVVNFCEKPLQEAAKIAIARHESAHRAESTYNDEGEGEDRPKRTLLK